MAAEIYYATGRRKTSVSRVWIKYGQPKIVVNGKPVEKYFLRKIYTSILEAPLAKTDILDKIEIFTTVSACFCFENSWINIKGASILIFWVFFHSSLEIFENSLTFFDPKAAQFISILIGPKKFIDFFISFFISLFLFRFAFIISIFPFISFLKVLF